MKLSAVFLFSILFPAHVALAQLETEPAINTDPITDSPDYGERESYAQRPEFGDLQSTTEATGIADTTPLNEPLILRGRITEFSFTQPETEIFLDTEFQQWVLTAPSAVELRRLGWSSSSLFAGELVEVRVVPRPDSENIAELKSLTRANGALLLASLNQPAPEGFETLAGGMYSLDTDRSELAFIYTQLGFSAPDVEFERINADVLWNAEEPVLSVIQVDIDVASLRSGVSALDEALRGEQLFDSFNYPRIQFKSTRVRLLKWGKLRIDGQLKIKGQNQPISLEAELVKSAVDPVTQEPRVGIRLLGSTNRSLWGLSKELPVVEDEIALSFNGQFVLKAADIPSPLSPRLPSRQDGIDTSEFPETAPFARPDTGTNTSLDKASDNASQLTW